jgi:CheY-like chemotaxis protein
MLDLARTEPMSAEQTSRLAIARGAAEHCVALLTDILDAASLAAGAFELAPRAVDLRHTLEEAMMVFSGRATQKGLRLRLEIAKTAPEVVVLDPQRLKQVVMNLVGNAVKFTERGSVTICARAAAGGRLRIEVSDTGPGLDEAARARLFARFVQLEPTETRSAGGTGLGLSICRDIVGAMGGEIGAEGAPGAGSTFWVEIPAARAADPPDAAPAPAAGADRRLRTLVVDDSEINRLVAGQMLTALGHDVAFAEDGAEAVDMVAETPFDVIFMDGEMPRMGGLDTARAISTDWATHAGAIIGLTAHAGPLARSACLEAGMVDVVVKPVRQDDLARALSRLAAEPRREA